MIVWRLANSVYYSERIGEYSWRIRHADSKYILEKQDQFDLPDEWQTHGEYQTLAEAQRGVIVLR